MKIRNRLYILLTALGIIFCSCESLVDNINDNPNDPTVVPPQLLLTGIELANITVQVSHIQRITGMWSGQYTGNIQLYGALYEYLISTEEPNDTWEAIYQGILQQARVIQEGLPNDPLYQGISKVVEAHAIGTATQIFGDVPYSEAASPDVEDPVFDGQALVYQQLQGRLDEAIADFQAANPDRELDNEIFYQGAALKWIEAAYTLKARYYTDVKDYSSAYTAAQNGISSGDNSMKYFPPGMVSNGDANLLNTFINERGGFMDTEGTYLNSLLDGASTDTRNNAKTNEEARFNYYQIGGNDAGEELGVAARTAPMPLVLYEENLLILAEAAARTVDFATALGHLNELRAFLASGDAFDSIGGTLQYDAYDAADFQNGGMENPDNVDQTRALLREIIEERYVSGYGQFIPFNDARRLRRADPDLVVPFPLNTATATAYPERIIYSQEELNANSNAPNPAPDIFTVTPVNQ